MSRSVSKNSSGRITVGLYSTSACSCVRLTATFSTPGSRPRAFSSVPVQSEQCSPPILARKRACLGSNSSAQYGVEDDGSVVGNVVFSNLSIRNTSSLACIGLVQAACAEKHSIPHDCCDPMGKHVSVLAPVTI